MGEYKWGEKYTVSKVSYENGVESFKFGNDTGNNLWINQENMYIVDEEQIENIYNQVNGLTAYSFEGKTIIDPALDVGDKIIIDGKPIIYQGEADFQTRFIAEISSKIAIKQKQETTTKETSQKVINRRVQSRIDEAEGKITQLVEETTENSQKISQVEQTVDGITQTVSNVETKVETVEDKADNAQNTADSINKNLATNYYTKTETTSQINQKANEITSTVSQTYSTKTETTNAKNEAINSANASTDEKLEDYSTTEEMNSAITQKADSITQEVNHTINNIQVGGTNLIPNSGPYNTDNYMISDEDYIELTLQNEETAPFGKCIRIRTKTDISSLLGIYIIPTCKVLKQGQEYCFSLWLKATAQTTVTVGYARGGQTTLNVTTEYKKFTYKFTALAPTSDSHGFVIYLPSGTISGRQIYVHSIKLEEGNKNTGWSPAPDDIATKVEMNTKIEQTAEEINLEVNKKVGNDELCSKISQSADKISLIGNRISISSDNFKLTDNGEVSVKDGSFKVLSSSGTKLMDFSGSGIRFYHSTGYEIGGLVSTQEENGFLYLTLWRGTNLAISKTSNDGTYFTNMMAFSDIDEVPYIRNAANGTILPGNPGGGIKVENGLITSWSLQGGTFELNNVTVTGMKVVDGLVMSVTYRDN